MSHILNVLSQVTLTSEVTLTSDLVPNGLGGVHKHTYMHTAS